MPKDKNKKLKIFFDNFDFLLLALSIAASLLGIILIISATNSYNVGENTNLKYILIQSITLVLGITAIFISLRFDYEYLSSAIKIIYAFNIVALVMVFFIGQGEDSWGAKRWIRFGPIGIQPSEVVKIGFIMTLSYHIQFVKETINQLKNVLLILLHAGVVIVIIMAQPDLGTSMMFLFITLAMLFVAGLSYKYFLVGFGIFSILAPLYFFTLMEEYQKNRILGLFNPDSFNSQAAYHLAQSKLSIGSGQIFGKGLFKGTQIQMSFLPTKETDFIFAVAGEEFGFIGCVVIILLLASIVVRCFTTARLAKDDFGSLLCIGIACMFMFHIIENIGMCIGLLPITGIPLPFISYGGSSLATSFVAIAIVINVRYNRKIINF